MSRPPTSSIFTGLLATLLEPAQRRWHAAVFVVLTLLSADTLYLLAHRSFGPLAAGAAWGQITSEFYQAAVLLHSLLGYVLTLLLLVFAALHVPMMLRRLRRRWLLLLTGTLVVGSFGFLIYSGTFFLLHSKSAANQNLYWAHMVLSGLFLAIYAGHRLFAAGRFPLRPVAGLFAAAGALAAVMVTADLTGIMMEAAHSAAAAGRTKLPPVADEAGFTPVTGVNPAAPFFPSPVALASGAAGIDTAAGILGFTDEALAVAVRSEVERQGYARGRRIGAEDCARCHADTVAQWESSAHRFSSFNNPFYAAAIEKLRQVDSDPNPFLKRHLEAYGIQGVRTGQIKSQWCAGCHDPALLFEGRMRREIDRGEIRAQAGLTCLACHQIKDVPAHTGSANYVWNDDFKDPYLFANSNGPVATWIHDLYLKANPEQHKRDMLKPVFREGQYCSTCHKVSLEPPLNEYHYVRGQDEYDIWHDSGVPLNAARTFYQPKQASKCQTCHMPEVEAVLGDLAAKNGKIKSHRFLAANTALPFLRGDTAALRQTEEFLRDNKLRIFFAGLRAGERIAQSTEAPETSLELVAGESPELNIGVRNLAVGHTFPGGTNDSNEGWIEIAVHDEHGRTLLRAGGLDPQGRVIQNTRIYNVVFIDRFSKRVAMRNAQDIAAPVYLAVIPPSSTDLARFRVPLEAIPADAGKLTVTARLLWRKFNRDYSEFVRSAEPKAFAAVGPDLPVTEVAAATAELTVARSDRGATLTLHANSPVPAAQRHLLSHDYGIGLLLQGDTRGARQVLEGLATRQPDCANCQRTLARLYLADRDYPAARNVMAEHERRWPGDPQGAWMWAGVLRGEGDDAAEL